jgi:hypothetical protein
MTTALKCPCCSSKLVPHTLHGIACWRCDSWECPLAVIVVKPEDDPPASDDDDRVVYRVQI